MKLDLLKTGFKIPTLLTEIPHEVLDGIETEIIGEYFKQTRIATQPTIKSVLQELITDDNRQTIKAFTDQFKNAKELDLAQQQIALFKIRSQASRKVIEKIYTLQDQEGTEKDIEILYDRLTELKHRKEDQLQLPINAKHWEELQKSEEEEIMLHIDWFKNNNVPIKKKVLYSFIATTNGGKTILKTWFAHELIKTGSNVLYLAQEEPREDTIRRIHQSTLDLTEHQYRKQTENGFEDVGKRFNKESEKEGYGNLYVVEWPGIKISRIRQYLNDHQKQHNETIDALIIDYGKLVETDNAKASKQEWERIGLIFKELKELAMKENVAVITSIQLNRESSKDLVEKGLTADLFDVAGAWEATHHVNYVWAVRLQYPDIEVDVEPENPNQIKGIYTLTVQKQKYGDLRKGDWMQFQWLSSHRLLQRDVPEIEIPEI